MTDMHNCLPRNDEHRQQARPRAIVLDRERDSLARLDGHVPTFTDFTGKNPVPAARIPRDGLATIVTFGQSNAANHGGARYTPRREFFNFNFVSGDFFIAEDPLLGASGNLGNFATRLGDKLLTDEVFKSVLFAPLALGASMAADWSPDGFAHRRLLVAVQRLWDAGITPTHFLWHQGESDASMETSQADYERAFGQMVDSLRGHGIHAPIYVAVASRCGNDGSDAVRAAQRALLDPRKNIYPGPDTDALGSDYRFDDCHFSERGLEAHADLWLETLRAATVAKV